MSLSLSPSPGPVVLCILDGWGIAPAAPGNAISVAHTPNHDRLLATCPHAQVATSGPAVGLPENQMGNSEVGHTSIGTGRIPATDLTRVNRALADGSLRRHPLLVRETERLRRENASCHIAGLLSPGGVHSHHEQIAALARIIAGHGVNVLIHVFLDGRDTPPDPSGRWVGEIEAVCREHPGIRIATVIGRYYAMDRDNRHERTARARDLVLYGTGEQAPCARDVPGLAHRQGKSDEFCPPFVIPPYTGVRPGDGLVFANFRADRARQILTALLAGGGPATCAAPGPFGGAPGPFGSAPGPFGGALGLVHYSAQLDPLIPALLPPEIPGDSLGACVSAAGMTQLRAAETEKYAHVTFFFSGGREQPFPGEQRILVPSPDVATYDLCPEMSAVALTDALAGAIDSREFRLVVTNIANPDMVGHTGVLDAAVTAAATTDACLGRLEAAVLRNRGILLVTADHGNLETMLDPETGKPHTRHTLNPTPVILAGGPPGLSLRNGRLCDIAPTLLPFLGLGKPSGMTGHSLLCLSS